MQPFERCAPDSLWWYLVELPRASSPEEVWALLLRLAERLGVPFVTYGFTPNVTSPEVDFLYYSNLPEGWMERRRGDNSTATDYAYWHTWQHMTPILIGAGFLDLYEGFPPAYRALVASVRDTVGWETGLCVPLACHGRLERAAMTFGTRLPAAAFLDFLRAEGWVLHVAAAQAHARHQMLLRERQAARARLSPRMLEFLRRLAATRSRAEVEASMGIGRSRGDSLIAQIKARLSVQTMEQAVAVAVQVGLIEGPLVLHGNDAYPAKERFPQRAYLSFLERASRQG